MYTTQCPLPGLKPRPLNPELSALTMMPPCLPQNKTILENNIVFSLDNLIFIRSNFCWFLVWYLREAQHSSAEEKGDKLNYIITSVTLTYLDIVKLSVNILISYIIIVGRNGY